MDEDDDEGPIDYSDDPDAAEAVRVAKAVLAGSTPVVEGCRRLRKPLYELYVMDEQPFSVIFEVAGKVSEFPMPEDRHLWNPAVVAVKDAELEAWLPQVQGRVFDACNEVIRRFGAAG
jgi:hypothetical protein